MDVTLVLFTATISILIGKIDADVPSCERARCHHCQMNFIAEMCPENCRSCSKRIAAAYHHFPMSPQQSQPETQLLSVRQFSTTPSPPVSNQQTLLDPVFPTFPPLLTFTFPTLPPFTFPTVTFAPPIYHSALPQIPSNPFPIQMPPLQRFDPIPDIQTQLFQPQRQIGLLGSEQTVAAPYATIGSQPQIFLQPHPPQTHPTSYAIQQQAVPVYPANKQQSAAHLPTQQLQSQQQVPYLQVQQQQPQPQYHFYTTNQQPPLANKPLPQLPPKVKQPLLMPSHEYSIDAPTSYIKGTNYKTNREQPPVITQCPRQPNWEPCITKELANNRFKECCQELGQGCAAVCNYDATLTTIQLAVLTGQCPLNKVSNVMICASGYQDATACCEAYNVFEPGYEHCRPYCNPAAGMPQGVLLSEQFKCLGKLSQIQRCFYVSQRP